MLLVLRHPGSLPFWLRALLALCPSGAYRPVPLWPRALLAPWSLLGPPPKNQEVNSVKCNQPADKSAAKSTTLEGPHKSIKQTHESTRSASENSYSGVVCPSGAYRPVPSWPRAFLAPCPSGAVLFAADLSVGRLSLTEFTSWSLGPSNFHASTQKYNTIKCFVQCLRNKRPLFDLGAIAWLSTPLPTMLRVRRRLVCDLCTHAQALCNYA